MQKSHHSCNFKNTYMLSLHSKHQDWVDLRRGFATALKDLQVTILKWNEDWEPLAQAGSREEIHSFRIDSLALSWLHPTLFRKASRNHFTLLRLLAMFTWKYCWDNSCNYVYKALALRLEQCKSQVSIKVTLPKMSDLLCLSQVSPHRKCQQMCTVRLFQ